MTSIALPKPRPPGRAATGRVIPGFGISLGFTIFYLALIVLIPLSAVFLKTFTMSWEAFWAAVTSERVVASYKLSFGASLLAAFINVIFGGIVAWVLVRYTFPGKRIIDALVDLPFALPTAVAGITLTALYSHNGLIGEQLAKFGIKVAFTPLGVLVALTFIGLPFVVRTVQPVLETKGKEKGEAKRKKKEKQKRKEKRKRREREKKGGSLSELTRQITSPTKNGHAPPPIESRKSFSLSILTMSGPGKFPR
eukprot:TRINITY_DN2357_c1_g1_i5.p1 TRINITY_DN2357_c1_g1~~TRINITY_DN2357_c1_g1_i5.p1  ORF type:complete len:252 (+),score=49.28 TRINITY_DN2357_c1_g1_i5:180-935(+)